MGKNKNLGELINWIAYDSEGNILFHKSVTLGESPDISDDSLKVATTAWVTDKIVNKADLIDGKVPEDQLPAYVSSIVEYPFLNDFPAVGNGGTIYIETTTNKQYRWSGTAYVEIGGGGALGSTNDLPEGSSNLYFTQTRVSANPDVVANTSKRHDEVSLGTANGLAIAGQQLSLGLSSTSSTGALSSPDWNTFNGKEPALPLGTSAQYFRGDKTLATLPVYTLAGLGGQPLDADLTAIAALGSTQGLLAKTGANSWAIDTTNYQTFIVGGNTGQYWRGDKTWQNFPSIVAQGGQPLDTDLTVIASISATSGLLRKVTTDTWVLDTNAYLTSLPAHTHAISDVTGLQTSLDTKVSSTNVTNILRMTQAEYDALPTKSDSFIYFIV